MNILSELLHTLLATIVDVVPIAVILFGFQFFVIRKKPANLAATLIGFV